MTFNPKHLAMACALPMLMTACAATTSETKQVQPSDLQHHNWQLVAVNDVAISVDDHQAPHLEIGEAMTANGNAGCNQFFGQGELKENQFRIEKMGSTMKLCQDDKMELEQAMTHTLSNWSEMTLTEESLTLSNDRYKLSFKLRDWVN